MTKSLPSSPSLEHLKKEAKAILKSHRAGDDSVCEILKHLSRFAGLPDKEVLSADLTLLEVQQAVSVEYGFHSWAEMKWSIEAPMFTDMSERDFIRWNLSYTMEKIIRLWNAIPDEYLCVKPKPYLNAPAFVFGNIPVKERVHTMHFNVGPYDIPERYEAFHGFYEPTQEQLEQALESKQALVGYWREVRGQTLQLLSTMSDAELKEVRPNSMDPKREPYVQSIMLQNLRWGELQVLHAIIMNELVGEEHAMKGMWM